MILNEKFLLCSPDKLQPMHTLDSVRLNFDPGQLILMNVLLAFIMFGIALDLKRSDFKILLKKPRWILICLFAQLIALPLMTLYYIYYTDPIPSVVLGLAMVASCPGGNISNFFTHLAKGNTALSIALTSVVTCFSFVFTPLVFAGILYFLPPNNLAKDISLSPLQVGKTVLLIIVLPLIFGMMINHYYGHLLQRVRKIMKTASLLIFAVFILFALKGNWNLILNYLYEVFSLVVVHNALALLVGFATGWIFFDRLDNIKTITIETGIQNSGLGLILIFNYFSDLGGMAMVAAFWGVWDMIVGLILAYFWGKWTHR